MPTMTFDEASASSMGTSLPVAMMVGLDRNPADTHFGNNVSVSSGGSYKLMVTIKGETASFDLTAPKA